MASFTNQITYYTGDASSYSSEITQLLTDAQKSVIARLESMNPDILHLFSDEVTVENDSGVTLDHTKVLNVRRGSYRAVPVNVQHKDLIVDSDSIYYALPQSPAYYIDKSKLYIKPAPEVGDGGTVDKVVYGTIDDANGAIASFPAEFYQAIVLYSAQGVLHMMMVALRDALPDDFDDESSAFDVVSDFSLSETGYFSEPPSAPEAPDFGDAGAIAERTFTDLPDAPVYTKPTIGILDEDIIIPTYPLTHGTNDIDLSDSNDLIELSVSQALSLSSANTLDMDGVTYPAYTAPTIGLAASNPDVTIPELDIGQLSLDLTDGNDLIDIDLDTELEAPDLTSAVTLGDFGDVPSYTAPTVPVVTSDESNPTLVTIATSLGEINDDQDEMDYAQWWNVLSELIEEEEDTELGQLQISKIGAYVQAYSTMLQQYQAEVQNALNVFNEENVVYQASVQKAIQEAQHADQHSAQLLQKWQGLVAQHQQQINQAVLDYKTQYDVKYQKWQFDYTQKMQEYSLAVQNALNVFNKTNALYQGRIQTATQDAQLAESLEGRKLQKHSALMQEYQAQVNNAVQEWTLDNQKKIDEWQVKYGHKLQEFNTELQNELNVYNGLAAEYQQEVQKLVTEYQLQSQRLMAMGQNDLSRVAQEYSNSLGRYQNEISHYQADLAKEIQIYSTNLSKNIQAFQAHIGKDTLVYQWLQGQLQFVTNLYEQFYIPYATDVPEDLTHVGVAR